MFLGLESSMFLLLLVLQTPQNELKWHRRLECDVKAAFSVFLSFSPTSYDWRCFNTRKVSSWFVFLRFNTLENGTTHRDSPTSYKSRQKTKVHVPSHLSTSSHKAFSNFFHLCGSSDTCSWCAGPLPLFGSLPPFGSLPAFDSLYGRLWGNNTRMPFKAKCDFEDHSEVF